MLRRSLRFWIEIDEVDQYFFVLIAALLVLSCFGFGSLVSFSLYRGW